MAYIQQDLRGQPNNFLVENWQQQKDFYKYCVYCQHIENTI